MFDGVFDAHIRRVRAAVLDGFSLAQIPEWIVKHTTLRNMPFSYEGHEYQLDILKDPSPIKNVRKCSQIGMSELSVRSALAMADIMDGFTTIYTLPTASFSRTFAQTRVNPVITGSPKLKYKLNPEMNNAEVKQFDLSFLYFKGTMGQGAAISVPADALIHDELDFSDPDVIGSYQSRLTHSPYKLTWKFSTPTVNGLGISAELDTSRRFHYMAKCCHCNEWFLPDYFQHVRVPNFRGDLMEISKDNLHKYRYKESWLECPKCSKHPDLNVEHREWVCENPQDQYDAAGYQIQPFDAPKVITIGDLVKRSTEYSRYVDFVNFGLGKAAEDKDSSLTKEDIDACYVPGAPGTFYSHVMGVDMGLTCHIIIAGVDPLGHVIGVRTKVVPLALLADEYIRLRKQYRVSLTVMDTFPYVDTVMRLQTLDQNLYGAVSVDTKGLEPFFLKRKEGEPEEGKLDVRQVSLNKNRALDALMVDLRSGKIFLHEDDNRPIVTQHMMDMKRVKDFTMHHEMTFVWKKSKAKRDHFHMALLYAWIASKLRGVSVIDMPSLPFVSSMRLSNDVI